MWYTIGAVTCLVVVIASGIWWCLLQKDRRDL